MQYSFEVEFSSGSSHLPAIDRALLWQRFTALTEAFPEISGIEFKRRQDNPEQFDYTLLYNGKSVVYLVTDSSNADTFSFTVNSMEHAYPRRMFQNAGDLLQALMELAIGSGLTACELKQAF